MVPGIGTWIATDQVVGTFAPASSKEDAGAFLYAKELRSARVGRFLFHLNLHLAGLFDLYLVLQLMLQNTNRQRIVGTFCSRDLDAPAGHQSRNELRLTLRHRIASFNQPPHRAFRQSSVHIGHGWAIREQYCSIYHGHG